jgi:hypothetical protein
MPKILEPEAPEVPLARPAVDMPCGRGCFSPPFKEGWAGMVSWVAYMALICKGFDRKFAAAAKILGPACPVSSHPCV